ncbi:MAG TPA: replication-associated recombination protein A [Polyangiales bacterium]|nr:replication-associated recombination protein A [Polyangiales bacterium]
MDLFDRLTEPQDAGATPLAERMRPEQLEDVVGQAHLLGADKLLGRAIAQDRVPSLILWGPPGTGKTTLAKLIAKRSKARFHSLSAVLSGVPDLRKAVEEAREQKRLNGRRTLLFVDEIHRFNKAQQDALLPHVEAGTVTLIGATTENPSFAVNAALLSRARVFQLKSLSEDALVGLLSRALSDRERGLGALDVTLSDDALRAIAKAADGDARRSLDSLDSAVQHAKQSGLARVELADLAELVSRRELQHDKSGEAHYNVVSAFIKSMRGSDPDAALYWMMRMLEAGEDPRFVLRRLIIFASEDIGNADPRALQVVIAADQAFARLGMPEGLHPLAQACTFLACSPKSNASYVAFSEAQADVRAHGSLSVPMKLRNAPTRAMKEWGYGEGYRYPHDEGGVAAGETYLPEELVGKKYYRPTQNGEEARIAERMRKHRER